MTSDKKANIDTGLHNWDSILLSVICYLTALSFLPALAAATSTPIARPEIKPFAVSFLIIELIWITWKGLKKSQGYIHAIVLVLVAAIVAVRSLADTSLGVVGFLQLFVIPIFVFLFTVKRAGKFSFLYGLVLVFFGSLLVNWGILLSILTQKQWLGLTNFFMLLTTGITLPILFINSQEQGKEREVLEKEQLPCG